MGRKYTIELEEKPFFNEEGNALYRVKGFRSLVFDEQGIKKLEPYTEPEPDTDACIDYLHKQGWLQDHDKQITESEYKRGYKDGTEAVVIPEDKVQEAYQKGLNDGWESARKIVLSKEEGGLFEYNERKAVLGCGNYMALKKYSATEAVEKIRQYEEEARLFRAGDEVVSTFGIGIVTNVTRAGVELFHKDGSTGYDRFEAVKKTGRHFPEFVELLAKMKGEKRTK